MRFSKLITKSDTQKQWLSLILIVDFMILNISNFYFSFFLSFPWINYTLEGIITNICREKNQLNVKYSYSKQILDKHFVQCHLLAHHLHRLLKHGEFSWKKNRRHKLIGFAIQCVFKNVFEFFLHSIQNSYIVSNHFHICKVQKLFTWLCLRPRTWLVS